jgi:hypothetical protein
MGECRQVICEDMAELKAQARSYLLQQLTSVDSAAATLLQWRNTN